MKYYLIILYFFSLLPQILISSSARAQDSVRPNPIDQDDLVHFGDLIDVDVLGGFEFDWRGSLTPDGFLDGLDGYSEPVYGLCRSETDIAAEVTKVLSRILRAPKVVVKIIDRSNRAVVRLDGAVRNPTRFTIRRTVRLRELIVMAGGIIDGASGEISIFRPNDLNCVTPKMNNTGPEPKALASPDNGSQITNIKIYDLLRGDIDANPQILSGYIVTILRAEPIYVIGAVNNPRPVYSREKMTLSRIVATAGGLAKDAEDGKVSIFRRNGLAVLSIETDLGKIKRGETVDEILQPFDIVDVASRNGGKRKYPPVAASEENRDRLKQNLPLRVVE